MVVFRDMSLPLGSLIEIRVLATNLKGSSDQSELNTEGAIVQNVP
jgi:hypothetical protein